MRFQAGARRPVRWCSASSAPVAAADSVTVNPLPTPRLRLASAPEAAVLLRQALDAAVSGDTIIVPAPDGGATPTPFLLDR
jgi:hypothetical protein